MSDAVCISTVIIFDLLSAELLKMLDKYCKQLNPPAAGGMYLELKIHVSRLSFI